MKDKNKEIEYYIEFDDEDPKRENKKPTIRTLLRRYIKTHFPDRIQDAPKK